ncbi:hypothetical protein (plasmid) [Metabacillus dongyingensis]|nr:hypothetical protein [Metabacillus dongyingensis]
MLPIILLSLHLLTFRLSARSVWRLAANGTGTYGMWAKAVQTVVIGPFNTEATRTE